MLCVVCVLCFLFFQAEDGIRDLVRSRGLGDVYKRQAEDRDRDWHRPVHRDDPRRQPIGRDDHGRAVDGLSLIHI